MFIGLLLVVCYYRSSCHMHVQYSSVQFKRCFGVGPVNEITKESVTDVKCSGFPPQKHQAMVAKSRKEVLFF